MVLIISDNLELLTRFRKLAKQKKLSENFEYACSHHNQSLLMAVEGSWLKPLNIKSEKELHTKYDLIISLHCKQLFPAELVKNVRCVNVHPGYNPYNRGWFPQVFSILNKLPAGATIHEIDEMLDHGNIIAQKNIHIESWDTSFTAYQKILDAEMELLEIHLESILENTYQSFSAEEGNLNLKKDFDALCEIDLQHTGSFSEHIDVLRALSHGDYNNAYFLDEDGRKVFIKIELFPRK